MPTSQALTLTDNKLLDTFLSDTLAACGVESLPAASIAAAWARMETHSPDLVLTDLDLKESDALEFVKGMSELNPAPYVVVLAGPKSMLRAKVALDAGAATYLRKPAEAWEVERTVGTFYELQNGHAAIAAPDVERKVFGSSPTIQAVLKIVEQVAGREEHLMLVGEPGAGKRLIGRVIHSKSDRGSARFLALGCAGLSESLIERELFGQRGPNVGMGEDRQRGCFELCDHGTLLLDEVGDLPRRMQEKILKCMSRQSFSSPGGLPRTADVRVIATSSQNLEEKVAAGRFLKDLFERLQGICISVPPLRERRSDIPILVDQFVRVAGHRSGNGLRGASPTVLERLMQYDWPGNVRELKDIVTHSASVARGPVLGAEDLPSLPEPLTSGSDRMIPGATIQEIEKDAILRTLEATQGSTSRAARMLDMSVRKIQYKLKEYRMDAAAVPRLEQLRSAGSSREAQVRERTVASKIVSVPPKNLKD